MVKLSPDNQMDVWQGGYEYSIGSIHGFSFIHGWTMAGLMTMPANGDLTLKPGTADAPFKGAGAGFHSRFRHADEKATPGYYCVYLLDPKVKVELTATQRTGYQRISFPADLSNRFMVSLNVPAEYGYDLKDAMITSVSDSQIQGYAHCYSAGFNDYTLYFVMEFSKPFERFNGWVHQQEVSNHEMIKGDKDVGVYLCFPTTHAEQVVIRTGVSFVSIDGARNNLKKEAGDYDWDFDALVKSNHQEWNNLLSAIIVKGASKQDKIKFYTNFYRCFTSKMNMCDADGK